MPQVTEQMRVGGVWDGASKLSNERRTRDFVDRRGGGVNEAGEPRKDGGRGGGLESGFRSGFVRGGTGDVVGATGRGLAGNWGGTREEE